MRRALCILVLAGLFVLLLSALVVTPEPPAPPKPEHAPADFRAVFRPVISAILPESADMPAKRADPDMPLYWLPVLLMCAAVMTGTRDANGRILTDARYENSVYQLFRPETAGG